MALPREKRQNSGSKHRWRRPSGSHRPIAPDPGLPRKGVGRTWTASHVIPQPRGSQPGAGGRPACKMRQVELEKEGHILPGVSLGRGQGDVRTDPGEPHPTPAGSVLLCALHLLLTDCPWGSRGPDLGYADPGVPRVPGRSPARASASALGKAGCGCSPVPVCHPLLTCEQQQSSDAPPHASTHK